MVRHRTSTRQVFSATGRGRPTVGNSVRTEEIRVTDGGSIIDSVHSLSGLGQYDVGGNMYLDKTTVEVFPYYMNQPDDGWNIFYNGPVIPNVAVNPSSRITYSSPKSDNDLIVAGTTSIARSSPTNPSSGLSQFLGELRNDGMPSLPSVQTIKERTVRAKSAGGEYLNVEFGWKPLISDLKKLAYSVKHSHKIVSQYVKGSDSTIRRAYSSPSTSFSNMASCSIGFTPGTKVLNATGSGYLFESEDNESWFRGAFKYHIPGGDDLHSKFSRYSSEANKLLGTRLTPETVYNLAPWTWAADWFSNTGDVIHNISMLGHDGLVLLYGYQSSRQVRTSELVCTSIPCSKRVVSKTQRRVGATPYGFGTNLATLSASQEAVLVALGLSHGSR